MNRRQKTALALAIALTLTAAKPAASAQEQEASLPTTDGSGCTYNFTSTNLTWCLSSSGNLQQLKSPISEHIAVGAAVEGYLICVNGEAVYWDKADAGASANWNAPALHAGPTASGVTVRRTTSDGKFMLEQKWTRDAIERDLTLQMRLENKSGLAVRNVTLIRIVDLDVHGEPTNLFVDSLYGAYFQKPNGHAVSVASLTLNVSWFTRFTDFFTAYYQNPCNPGLGFASTGTADVVAWVGYFFDMSAGSSKTVKIGYQVQ